jgi:hypothetical protein
METMREAWTDERLDDLKDEMRASFGRVDADIRELRTDIRDLTAEMNSRFDALQRTMIIGFATMGGGILAAVTATILAAVLG